jgi:hypothetical protein
VNSLSFDDVGKEVEINVAFDGSFEARRVKVVMGIKAPRGSCFLFALKNSYRTATIEVRWLKKQREAVRAFMKQHRRD